MEDKKYYRHEWVRYLNTALLVVLIIVLLMKGCGNGPSILPGKDPIIIRDTTVLVTYDTITNESVSYVPQYYEREIIHRDSIIVHDSIMVTADTAAILEDYYAKLYYQDTVIDTDSALVVVNDTLSQNRIWGRSTSYKFIYPTREVLVTEKQWINPRELYLGGNINVGVLPWTAASVQGGLMLRTKRGFMLGVDGGVILPNTNNQLKPYFGVQYYHKITKK